MPFEGTAGRGIGSGPSSALATAGTAIAGAVLPGIGSAWLSQPGIDGARASGDKVAVPGLRWAGIFVVGSTEPSQSGADAAAMGTGIGSGGGGAGGGESSDVVGRLWVLVIAG
jgi:hypothetical protein